MKMLGKGTADKVGTKILLLWILAYCFILGEVAVTRGQETKDFEPPRPNDVHISPNAIIMPLGKIVLVRKDTKICALKFTRFWTGKTEEDRFAEYECYYQGDSSGNLAKENVIHEKRDLSFPKPRGIGRFAFSLGEKELRCGPIRLFWAGNGSVYFYGEGEKQGDYGIELAPTKWSEILEVNVFDTRLKWYRYDSGRARVNIPVDQLWQGK